MYNVLDITEYIIKYCNEKNRTISNLKLQKLLYFVQAEFLVNKGKPCFSDPIEAWDFGPVVPTVYHKYLVYGSASIPYVEDNNLIIFSKNDKQLMNSVLDEASNYSAAYLTKLTLNQLPWTETYNSYKHNLIVTENILVYFGN